MRLFLQLAAVICAISASSVTFFSLPQSIKLPATNVAEKLDSQNIGILNANLLGLSAQTPKGFAVQTSLFSRPRALTIVQIAGLELPTDGDKYSLTSNSNADDTSVDEALAVTFGADREAVSVSGSGITGTGIAQQATQQKVDGTVIKSKLSSLRTELENIYALVAAIKASGTKFNKDSADIYRISIKGLAGIDLTADEKATAITDINNALEQLATALTTVYGDQVVLEVFSLDTNAAATPSFNNSDLHVIKKRAADDDNNPIVLARKQYNVSVMVSTDYPAIFAIFAGLVIALTLAVLYTTVGMMTMDPGKDSIIYRMTTTRMKKD